MSEEIAGMKELEKAAEDRDTISGLKATVDELTNALEDKHDRWAETSDTIKGVATALSKFQGEMEFAKASQTNPHFKSKFAGLPETVEAANKLLGKHGLSITQTTKPINSRMYLITRLMHGASGQWVRGWWPMMPKQQSQQALASEHTYARRQAIQGVLMIPAADDDAEAAEGRNI